MTRIGLTNSSFGLRRAGLLTLSRAAGLQVKCQSGLLWVTKENDPTDYWLGDGESVAIASGGRVIIQAEKDSWLEIDRVAPMTS